MRPIIDLLVRNIWWVGSPHHIVIVSYAHGGDGREDTAGVRRPTLLCPKVREVGQDVAKVVRFTDEDHSGRPEEI